MLSIDAWKTDLIIQITPKIIQDEYTGIVKSDAVKQYEDYVIKNAFQENDLKNKKLKSEKDGEEWLIT